MRRFLAILVLLASGLAQQTAVACPMGVAASDDAGETAGHVHGVGVAGERAETGTNPHVPGPEESCRLLVPCAGAALAAPEPAATRIHLNEAPSRQLAAFRTWSTTFLQNETPPPRLRV